MGVFFHILSTGGSSGASRITRYIAERDKDLEREGPGSRPLFSDDQDGLSYHRADRILDPDHGRPAKNDLIHFSVMIEPEEFDKLGANEKEKRERFSGAVREAMKGMANELNAEELTWVAGIHRNSQNPHVHIVMSKEFVERGTDRLRRINRIPKALLPHRENKDGSEVIVNGKIGDHFLASLQKQQELHRVPVEHPQLTPSEIWERLARRYQEGREKSDRRLRARRQEPVGLEQYHQPGHTRSRTSSPSIDTAQISTSWNSQRQPHEDRLSTSRIALGKWLELEFRLAFAEVWHDRAVQYGETYRFEVMDQSTGEERKISDLDVRRRAAARAARIALGNHDLLNERISADLDNHAVTLQQLEDARETKIAALGKDIGSLRSNLSKVEQSLYRRTDLPSDERLTPLISRETLSELQEQAVRLGLQERVSELENLRSDLSREHNAPSRTDEEAAQLVAQLNVVRADSNAKDARLENFEASVHLTTYEVHGGRWSLAALDKQISRRREDTKIIPERATHLNWHSLTRINYSAAAREQAAADVQHLIAVRSEIVRQIEERRAPLLTDRDSSREMRGILETAYDSEQHSRSRSGVTIPEPKYARYQINSLEASAETLRDSELLKEVHDWEKTASRSDSDINWEGRAVAREIMAGAAVEQAKERLQHFLETQRVASLHVGDHRTATLREVETRSLTDYVARTLLETREERLHRHAVRSAAKEHHGRLVDDFEKATGYHAATQELSSEAKNREPQFNDKEKINLEIYCERQNDELQREKYFELAKTDASTRTQELSASRSR